jgi:3,4-dihydroxy-2-butanone 4-phosphate synthase
MEDRFDQSSSRCAAAACALFAGEIVVLIDSDSDAHLLLAGEAASVSSTAFLVRHGSGVIFAALDGVICDKLRLVPMVGTDRDYGGTEYAVSVDSIDGTSTGISAFDRAKTLRDLTSPRSTPALFSRPGHVIPARARDNGVLEHRGPAEALVDMTRIAGMTTGGAFTALVSVDDPTRIAGTVSGVAFARHHGLSWVDIRDVIEYRNLVMQNHVGISA